MDTDVRDRTIERMIRTVGGDLRTASEFMEGTWQSSAEIIAKIARDGISNRHWRGKRFWTNNHALYSTYCGDAFLYFGSGDNTIFRKSTLNDAFAQLTGTRYYRPPERDVADAKENAQEKDLVFRISNLELNFENAIEGYGFINIDTSDLAGHKLNSVQRRLAAAVYGSMGQDNKGNSDYSRAMQMLNNEGRSIRYAQIHLLGRGAVLEKGDVALACYFDYFHRQSWFIASDAHVDSVHALRGIPEREFSRRRKIPHQ